MPLKLCRSPVITVIIKTSPQNGTWNSKVYVHCSPSFSEGEDYHMISEEAMFIIGILFVFVYSSEGIVVNSISSLSHEISPWAEKARHLSPQNLCQSHLCPCLRCAFLGWANTIEDDGSCPLLKLCDWLGSPHPWGGCMSILDLTLFQNSASCFFVTDYDSGFFTWTERGMV